MGTRAGSSVIRVSDELKAAIQARADKGESIESCLRRAFDLPPLSERLSAVKSLPIQALDVNEEVIIPWPRGSDGLADEARVAKIKRAIYNYARKSGRTFRAVGDKAGLKVWRAT